MSIFHKINQSDELQTLAIDNDYTDVEKNYHYFSNMPQFIQAYLISRISLNYSTNTIQRYIYDFKFFFEYVIEKASIELNMNDITLDDFIALEPSGVRNYVRYLAIEQKNNPKTINRKLSALKSVFSYLQQQDVIISNPIEGIERPKVGRSEPVFLTKQECSELLTFINNEDNYKSNREKTYQQLFKYRDITIIHLMMMTGLRISELCSLQVHNISWHRKEITVIGKGSKQRSVPLSDDTLNNIQLYLHKLDEDNRPTKPNDPLFVGYDFKLKKLKLGISVSAVQKMINRHLIRAKEHLPFLTYKHITAHKLRHSFATELAQQGVDVLTIQNLLGHESVATTQIYAHIQSETKKKAIALLNDG
ncbi:tyrosine-type recombinase/integrase [Bacillus sp. SCS-151]|uniref:tyrosine-type recombinase/integrase n=1 Tax=Nanhaiella sioensis TaxID=3115293 RepID=UPI00397A21A2